MPFVAWQVKEWDPDTELVLPKVAPAVQNTGIDLVRRVSFRDKNGKTKMRYRGVLPQWTGQASGQQSDPTDGMDMGGTKAKKIQVSPLRVVRETQVMSLFETLPPPDYMTKSMAGIKQYQRALCRSMDVSKLTLTPTLIMIGHLEDTELPAPLHVDGERPKSNGWTVVQWIKRFDRPTDLPEPDPVPTSE